MQPDVPLADSVRRMYAMFGTGSTAAADDLIATGPGVIGIGTDPAEWWVDEEVTAAFRAQVPEMHAAGMSFRPGDVLAYSEGAVGWVADRPALRLPDGSELPMRFTGVFRRDGDAWLMVQMHLSIGVSNQDALGTELTT